jgi:hypothetical protein
MAPGPTTLQPTHVTFIHGLANKPPVRDLRRMWLEALRVDQPNGRGFDLGAEGVDDAFVYWADLFYDSPLPAAGYEALADQLTESVQAANSALPDDPWVRAMLAHYPEAVGGLEAALSPEAVSAYENIPLPGFLKERLLAEFLREAHAYLFDANGLRKVIRRRVLDTLQSVPDGMRRVIVGHSQGTFIAYDVMTACDDCPAIDGFMTFGSPLGIDEVQEQLTWSRFNGFPARLHGDWVNVYDPLDVVSRPDPRLANDFRKLGVEAVIDVEESNSGAWRHSASKYLKRPLLRQHLRRLCGRG